MKPKNARDEVRCPKCGKAPPLQRVDGNPADLRLSLRCSGCGVPYVVPASKLKKVDLTVLPNAS